MELWRANKIVTVMILKIVAKKVYKMHQTATEHMRLRLLSSCQGHSILYKETSGSRVGDEIEDKGELT